MSAGPSNKSRLIYFLHCLIPFIDLSMCYSILLPELCIYMESIFTQNQQAALICLEYLLPKISSDIILLRIEPIFLSLCEVFLKQLSQDEVWTLRESCVYLLPNFSMVLPNELFIRNYLHLYKNFTKDKSQYVYQISYQNLGKSLAYFDKNVNSKLYIRFLRSIQISTFTHHQISTLSYSMI